MADESIPALEVSRLSFAYGPRTVLHEVAFRVMPGEFAVLLGPNGAGKSTLFALITRLFDAKPPGSVRIFGTAMRDSPGAALARLGVVFQQPTLDPDISVIENLLYHGALHGLPRAEARRRALHELERVELADRIASPVRALSGGQRRRAEVARALITRPALLLLDEATTGLDMPSRAAVRRHVRALCAEGLAVLWATHLIEEVPEEARVVMLAEGRVRAEGPVAGVLAQAAAKDLPEAFAALTAPAAAR
ncbi:ATP-binding cassette domain-containing protein [Paracraurococcus lichenis]|uniref:ATP-binding cassette domain-containing protein n=1 Tax=Paracraurococcus lichenis TaxID=3064888 RepID=A0ABT9E0M6_9PROT|nr:ATP-binding cassette domain-containing protein [Paracraurococcus sp. LOR1-02]MDO9709719.1 ATP-binding cassette domain-containing protein [Paracraurococcus sp. LOR1-02]